jgi:hypothetical protein
VRPRQRQAGYADGDRDGDHHHDADGHVHAKWVGADHEYQLTERWSEHHRAHDDLGFGG